MAGARAQIGFLRVISYASPYRYTLNAFVQLQYRDRDDGCGLTTDPAYQVGRLPFCVREFRVLWVLGFTISGFRTTSDGGHEWPLVV